MTLFPHRIDTVVNLAEKQIGQQSVYSKVSLIAVLQLTTPSNLRVVPNMLS